MSDGTPTEAVDATEINSSFADGPPLPEMREGLLTETHIARLFADIGNCTTILGIQGKGGVQRYAEAGKLTLETARVLLVTAAVRAVQIRYSYDGFEWSDTVMSLPDGFRLIRCQHPVIPAP